MKSVADSYKYVKKNDNDFSFMPTFFSMIGNPDYGKEAYSTLCTDFDTFRNDIWRSLSATASYVGESINTEILNYADNICNVELCKIRQLQSLASYFGIKYSIFQNMQMFPRELVQLMDILSIKREFLANKMKVDQDFADLVSSWAMMDDLNAEDVASSLTELRTISGFTWPDMPDNTDPISVDFGKHLDDQRINAFTYDIISKFLNSKLYMTYNDVNKTMICKHLSVDILEKDFELVNPNTQKIQDYKLKWNISKDFNQTAELDKIENGEAQLADYSNYEQYIIQLEKDGRDTAFDATQPATRFKYYREADVREYYKFIEGEYYNREVARLYGTASQYPVDNKYIELKSLKQVSLLKNDGTFNADMFNVATTEIVNAVEELRDIREQIKTLAQKNFMKGTFMLMSFAVNEYLSKTIAPACKRLVNTSPDYNSDTTLAEVIEYIDPTEYYNISCVNDNDETLNQRYWETGQPMQAIGAIDDTNIFATLPSVDSQNNAFDSAAIEKFYLQTLQSKFITSPKEFQSSHLYSFLCSVFDFAADQTTLSNGKIDTLLADNITLSELDSQLLSAQIAYESVSSVIVCCDLHGEDITLKQQLDASISNYLAGWRMSFEEAAKRCEDQVTSADNDISSNLMTRVYDTQHQLSTLDSTYKQLVINNLTYTGSYDDSGCSSFIDRLNNYVLSIEQGFEVFAISAVSASMMTVCNQMYAKYSELSSSLADFNENVLVVSYLSSVEYKQIPVSLEIAYTNETISTDETPVEIATADLLDKLSGTIAKNTSTITQYLNTTKQDFNNYLLNYQFTSISKLSAQLEPYLDQTTALSDFIFKQLPEMFNESISAIVDYKTKLFKKYTGLQDSNVPYANLKNTIHPSYQIHPYLSTFVEQYDYSYPIENIVNMTTQSIVDELKANIDQYIDDDGYLISLWKNPLNTNSDYISRYEKTSHTDVNNNQNKFFGYDGLFHPDALDELYISSDTFVSSIVPSNQHLENCYAGLDLTYDECQRIRRQIIQLSAAIITEARSVHDIYRYGLDAYGNAYILVKDYGISSINQLSTVSTQQKRTTSGQLWMKPKNYPLAMPAFVLSNDNATHTEDVSQLAVFGDEGTSENAMFTYSTIAKSQISGTSYYAPLFYDFNISEDKTTFIAIADYQYDDVSCQLPLLAFPAKKNSIEVNHGDADVTIYSLDKVKDRNNLIETLYYSNEISNWQFQCFFSKSFGVGVAYLSAYGNEAKLKAAYYNAYTEEEHNNVKLPVITLKCDHNKAIDTEITVDSYVDTTTGISKLVAAYLTDTHLADCSSYLGNHFRYDELSDYISTPSNKIVTRDIVIADNSLVTESEQVYASFSDCGFNPLLSGINAIDGSKLETALTSFPTVMKFQMIGPEKEEAIDFINVLPVRMFDSYVVDDDLSCADYRSIHFGEDNFMPIDVGDNPIYDSNQFIRALSGSDFTIRIDESYKNKLLAAGYSEDSFIDNLIKFPYLWNTSDNPEFPEQFVNACNENSAMCDNIELKLYKGHTLSCSWIKTDKGIQLDFNSMYYANASLSSPLNVFNRQHKFLSLKKAGETGFLQEYAGNQAVVTYYIKNISDDKPKFLLSASFETSDPLDVFSRIVTEDDTMISSTLYKRADLLLTIDNVDYTLIAENI